MRGEVKEDLYIKLCKVCSINHSGS